MYNPQSLARLDGPAPASEESGVETSVLDLRELTAAVYRSRYVVIAIIVGCMLLGVAFTLLATRKYEGVASVEVRQEAGKVLGTEQDQEQVATRIDVERFLDTQLDLVRSRRVATAVGEQLGLFRNDAFLTQMNVKVKTDDDSLLTEQEGRREAVIETLGRNLQVGYTGQTRILQIRFLSSDARLSARIANAFANNYIISNLQRKADASSYAREFLRGQLRDAQQRLEETERAALAYARESRIVDASNAAQPSGRVGTTSNAQPQSLITAQLVQLNQAYSDATAVRTEAEQRWRNAASVAPLSLSETLGNQAVQTLLGQRAIAQADLNEQLKTKQEDYPTVVQARARLNEVNRQLGSISGNIRQSIKNQYDVAQQRENELKAQLERLKGQTLVEQNQSIQLSILRREADTNRQQYETLLVRYNQLNAEAGVQANNLAIVDRATVNPKPASPKAPLNLAVALLAGLVLSALYVIAQVQLFEKVRTTQDVAERLGVPLLGAIPVSQDVLGDLGDRKSPVSESISLVRTALAMSIDGALPRTVMLTSVQPGEGKTNSCISLAVGFARLGKRVLIIDLDLRRPNIHRLLDLDKNTGASTVLSGQATAEQAIQSTRFDGVDVIVGGAIPPSPTDLIVGQQLGVLLTAMQARYDVVLVDAPPVLDLADAEILAGTVEAVTFVVESGRNSRRAVLGAITRITRNRGRLAGVILTKYDPGQQGYGYQADYSYKYSYGADVRE
ncbi:MAG TPA: polysaccharide biosynthesis tyrosine autokinase [Sphingomonas sp.]|jgi:capsular exopolysaccharide synthesis family protein